MGTVFIRRLPIECVIGVHSHERASKQRLLISVTLETDFTQAAATDALVDTVDYVAIAAEIQATAESGRFHLIETLAERLAVDLLTTSITGVTVEIEKPAALEATPEVGVRAYRQRDPER